MTITIGFWIVPVMVTLVGIIHSVTRPGAGDYGFDLVPFVWLVVGLASWAMYFLSLLF